MAEGGIVGRLFGGEEAEEAEEHDLGVSAADPLAIAAALDRTSGDLELNRRLGEYVEKQGRLADRQSHLVELQTEHLHEQREVQLDHLKLRRVGERMRVAIQSFFVAVGALIAIGFLWMVWSAANDHGLVVEAFSVPPDLAARGLTGQVVAKQVLDRLAQLQTQTVTMRPADTYTNNWGDDLKVEIPETGVSVGEVSRYLRGLLGHETHISGEVYRTASGLTVTARSGEGEDGGDSFSGGEADYDKLLQQAAESVFSRTQPYRYADYLQKHGRGAEARPVQQRLIDSNDAEQRAWGYVSLGGDLAQANDIRGSIAQFRLAAAQEAHFAPALVNLAAGELILSHDAEAVRTFDLLMADPSAVRREMAEPNRTLYMAGAHIERDTEFGDYVDAMRAALNIQTVRSARAHQQYIDNMEFLAISSHNANRARVLSADDPSSGNREAILGLAALEEGNLISVDLLRKALDSDIAAGRREDARSEDVPILAEAEARFGAVADARTQVSNLPSDCYRCLRARGTVASYAGDGREAEGWFAEAIRQAPGLPLAYVDRGQARFRARDLSGALSDAQTAVRLGPHDPDAYGLWGDVLARQRRWSEAKAKYDEALKYAPAWAAARRARDEVARRA